MNTRPQPSTDPGSLAETIYNELCKYMDAPALAEFVSNHPTMDEWRDELAKLKEEFEQAKGPYKRTWVTDFLVQTPKGTYKEYKRAS